MYPLDADNRIFALHRVQDMYADDVSERVHKATTSLWADVAKSLDSVKEDLADGREWEFHQQISPGLQEAIEAYTFERFLVAKQVVGLDETRVRFQGHLVTESDYVLGLMDMTGEMMRYAIAHLVDPTHGGVSEITTEICALMRKVVGTIQQLAAGGRATGPSWRELPKKLEVAHNSLSKVEAAMLSCVVRVAESGKTPTPSGMAVG